MEKKNSIETPFRLRISRFPYVTSWVVLFIIIALLCIATICQINIIKSDLLCKKEYAVAFLLTALFCFFVHWMIYRPKFIYSLKWIALSVYILGVGIHFYGYIRCMHEPITTTLLRSMIASAEMFLAESNLEGIIIEDKTVAENSIFIATYVIIYSSAVAVSLYYLISVFGKRLRSKIWLHVNKKRLQHNDGESWFIMLGVNDNALALARDLVANKKQAGDHILFLEEPDEKESNLKVSLSRIREFFSIRESSEEKIKSKVGDEGVVVLKMSRRINDVITDNQDDFSSCKHLCNGIGLHGIESWLTYKAKEITKSEYDGKQTDYELPPVSIFILGDSEEDNRDMSERLIRLTDINCRIYCHALSRDTMVYYPSSTSSNNATLEYIDSSHLAVQQLKKETDINDKYNHPFHPINFVEKDNKHGYVTSTFTALLLGFGQTGQEALDFLYSFGAFVGKDKKRSPFELFVLDSRMKELQCGYTSLRPGVDYSNIHFLESTVEAVDFWGQQTKSDDPQCISTLLDRVNYVVVSIGDDEKNFNIGIALLDFICRNRKEQNSKNKLKILAHVQNETPMMRSKLEFYNRKYNSDVNMSIFGRREDIWKYDIITNQALLKEAERFYNAYKKASSTTPDKSFSIRHNEMVRGIKTIYDKKDINAFQSEYKHITKSFRQEFQDIENTLHQYTKLQLCPKQYFRYADNIYPGYPKDSDPNAIVMNFQSEMIHFHIDNDEMLPAYEVFENLAIGEHIRWQASQETMGYIYGDRTDDILKTHCCMIPYARLNEVDVKNALEEKANPDKVSHGPRWGETKHYDWVVVKTTLLMNKHQTDKQD